MVMCCDNILSSSTVSLQPYGASHTSLPTLIQLTDSLARQDRSQALRQEDDDEFDLAFSHLTGRILRTDIPVVTPHLYTW